MHLPPQPSLCPQVFPAQLGVQSSSWHCQVEALQNWPVGQAMHLPSQPSSWPQVLPLQSGVQGLLYP